MSTREQVKSWRDRTVIDRAGERVGALVEIYVDDRSGEMWAAIETLVGGPASLHRYAARRRVAASFGLRRREGRSSGHPRWHVVPG